MTHIRLRHIIFVLMAVLMLSCGKVPGYVIPPDDMAEIMADMHIAESVVEQNRSDYYTDSLKQLMKQSVLAAHGVTTQQLDTSFVWYGHNISYYMEVYDKTIALLEHRLAETGNRIAAENISIAGDSVDVWSAATMLAINRMSPSNFITFSLSKDENWEKGDSYTWRARFTNNPMPSAWAIAAEYTDGTREIITSDISGDGWRELRLITDSTKIPENIYGYIDAVPNAATTLWTDGIMLIRNRVNPNVYNQRFRLQIVKPKNIAAE